MAEHAPHNNNSERKMLNTKNPNAIEIVHRAKISEVSVVDRKRINRIEHWLEEPAIRMDAIIPDR